MKLIALAFLSLISTLVSTLAFSAPDCICRAKDVVAYEGQIVCIATPNGPQLARCDKVLNNTSWRFLQQRCDNKVTEFKPNHNSVTLILSVPLITDN